MEKIVVKGSMFSLNDMKLMKETNDDINLSVVFVQPNGDTSEIKTNKNTFKICDMDNSNGGKSMSIIYPY